MNRCLPLVVVALLSLSRLQAAEVQFNRDIRPILSDNCFACHGPDAKHREAELRLDLRESALEKQAIVPGKPQESQLLERVRSSDPDAIMPPPSSHKKLSAEQIKLLEQWIADGAPYQKHWAYEPPIKPELPKDKHPIDVLVEAHLRELGLTLSPRADKRTLIVVCLSTL